MTDDLLVYMPALFVSLDGFEPRWLPRILEAMGEWNSEVCAMTVRIACDQARSDLKDENEN